MKLDLLFSADLSLYLQVYFLVIRKSHVHTTFLQLTQYVKQFRHRPTEAAPMKLGHEMVSVNLHDFITTSIATLLAHRSRQDVNMHYSYSYYLSLFQPLKLFYYFKIQNYSVHILPVDRLQVRCPHFTNAGLRIGWGQGQCYCQCYGVFDGLQYIW